MNKQAELYRGKAKTVYSTENPDLLVLEFRNDTSAGDGARIEQFDREAPRRHPHIASMQECKCRRQQATTLGHRATMPAHHRSCTMPLHPTSLITTLRHRRCNPAVNTVL